MTPTHTMYLDQGKKLTYFTQEGCKEEKTSNHLKSFASQKTSRSFNQESLFNIIMDCKPKIVVTCNAVKRGKKVLNLKDIVDAALLESSQNGVSDVVPKCSTTCDVEWVDAQDPLFLLYTSGSTRKPKGVLHTTGGVQLIVVGLLDTVMLLMDLCLMEQQLYFMKG
ncbi:hypothetical protein L2E82_49985 [Cichorium intybus]|nr:hypothetical protein L2E82_49985 [Cichorium intybus]